MHVPHREPCGAETTAGLIATKLSVSPEQVQAALRQLSEELHSQANEHGRIHIEGIGTLSRNGDALDFQPSAGLDLLINKEYAPLMPLRLTETQDGVAQPTQTESAPPWKRQRFKTILLTGLIIVGIQVAVVLVLLQTGVWSSPVSESTVAEPVVTLEQSEDETAVAQNSGSSAQETESETSVELPPDTAADDERQTDTEDLSSEPEISTGFDMEIGGYTIVLGSFEDAQAAIGEANRFRGVLDETYSPMGVIRTQSGDSEHFRVYIGQTSTVEEAVALKDQLANIPPGSWVIRIGAGSRVIQ